MNLVLCFDGTWNDEHGEHGDRQTITNVVRLYRNIATNQNQKKWYDKGVGTGFLDRIRGGAFGYGLDENIKQGYKWLSYHYNEGDNIFLFGFSRGAYTARSLSGLIHKCGLLQQERVDSHEQDPSEPAIGRAYDLYRDHDLRPNSSDVATFVRENSRPDIPIHFLGVWDTVGSLGIPDKLFLGDLDDRKYKFHDTSLNPLIRHAFHAVAIDEHRTEYDATLWSDSYQKGIREQVWFAGAHADVGGGYHSHELADVSLAWMAEKAVAKELFLVDEPTLPNVPAVTGDEELHDSFASFMAGWYVKLTGGKRHYRAIDSQMLHPTVTDRQSKNSQYQPRTRVQGGSQPLFPVPS